MTKFYIVSGDNVQKKELRETPKFYIDDATGEKFKKSENSDYLAHYRYNGGGWHSSHYYVYNLDHEKPNKIIEKNKRSMFAWKVKKAAEDKINNCKTYSDYAELNRILELGIEL